MPTVAELHATILRLLGRLAWLSPALLRLAVGATFVATGWGKLHTIATVTRYFASLGIPAPGVHAVVVGAIELVGGALLLLGLSTRIAAALLAGVMAVALATAIWPASDGLLGALGTLETVYLFVLVHLAIHGAGAASLDHVLARWLHGAATRPVPVLTRATGEL